MGIEIYEPVYLSGMPTMDYSIDTDQLRISFKKKDFAELVEKLGGKLNEDYQRIIKIKANHDRNVLKLQEFRRDIIGIFWDGDVNELDGCFIRREVSEIDQEKLYEILEKYNGLFGFE